MDSSLPDELISEILTPVLDVSDEMFSDISHISPFSYTTESYSRVLLVCKTWLRVATPLLYNTVVLRSKEQAQGLDATLHRNKDLGRFIKRLRVEGGFGRPMHHILRCSRNLTDLYLSLQIYSPDNTSGLVLGLPLVNPIRLILFDDEDHMRTNQQLTALFKVLVKCADDWDNLVRVLTSLSGHIHLCRSNIQRSVVLPSAPDVQRKSLSVALCSRNVKIASVPGPSEVLIPEYFREMGMAACLQTIAIRCKSEQAYLDFFHNIPDWPRFKSLLTWSDSRNR